MSSTTDLVKVVAMEPLRALCVVRESIMPNELALYAFRVQAARVQTAPDAARETALATQTAPPQPDRPVAGTPTRPLGSRARLEIIASIARVVAAREDKTFTVPEIMEDMTPQGTTYARQTIQTMISSHMNADKHHDVLRVERGRYRLNNGG